MDFAILHQTGPALHPLSVTPVVADMFRERPVDIFIVGIAQNPTCGIKKHRIHGGIKHALPAIHSQPARGRHTSLGLVTRIAFWQGANGAHGNLGLIG